MNSYQGTGLTELYTTNADLIHIPIRFIRVYKGRSCLNYAVIPATTTTLIQQIAEEKHHQETPHSKAIEIAMTRDVEDNGVNKYSFDQDVYKSARNFNDTMLIVGENKDFPPLLPDREPYCVSFAGLTTHTILTITLFTKKHCMLLLLASQLFLYLWVRPCLHQLLVN